MEQCRLDERNSPKALSVRDGTSAVLNLGIQVARPEYSKGVFLDLSHTPFEYSGRATQQFRIEDALSGARRESNDIRDVDQSNGATGMINDGQFADFLLGNDAQRFA